MITIFVSETNEMKGGVKMTEKRRKDIEELVYYLENYWAFRGTHKDIDRLIRELLEEILDEF